MIIQLWQCDTLNYLSPQVPAVFSIIEDNLEDGEEAGLLVVVVVVVTLIGWVVLEWK